MITVLMEIMLMSVHSFISNSMKIMYIMYVNIVHISDMIINVLGNIVIEFFIIKTLC